MRGASKVAAASAVLSCIFGGRVGGIAELQSSVAEPRVLQQLQPDSGSPGVVKKTTYSDKLRMIFLAGLEGSGHHTMNGVLRTECNSDNVECPNVCPVADALYNELGIFSNYPQYKNGLARLRTSMADLGSAGPLVSVATFGDCENVVGEMSFPNFGGIDKPLQHVDLRLLAEEAERAEIDLRVIYLGRSAESILISTTEHRRFGRWAAFESENRRQATRNHGQ